MLWLLKMLFCGRITKKDREVIEAIKNLPPCARVTGRGGFYRGPHCTKNKCVCGEGEYK